MSELILSSREDMHAGGSGGGDGGSSGGGGGGGGGSGGDGGSGGGAAGSRALSREDFEKGEWAKTESWHHAAPRVGGGGDAEAKAAALRHGKLAASAPGASARTPSDRPHKIVEEVALSGDNGTLGLSRHKANAHRARGTSV